MKTFNDFYQKDSESFITEKLAEGEWRCLISVIVFPLVFYYLPRAADKFSEIAIYHGADETAMCIGAISVAFLGVLSTLFLSYAFASEDWLTPSQKASALEYAKYLETKDYDYLQGIISEYSDILDSISKKEIQKRIKEIEHKKYLDERNIKKQKLAGI